jgi:hypothetical protein
MMVLKPLVVCGKKRKYGRAFDAGADIIGGKIGTE